MKGKIILIIIILIFITTINIECISKNIKNGESDPYFAPPIADAGRNQTVLVNETVYFNASNSYSGYKYLNVTWDFDDRDGIQVDSSEIKPSYVYKQPGNYIVTLTVYNPHSDGRIDTDKIVIIVLS